MNSNSNYDEREISLIDLFMYLLKRYRSIILVAFVGAVLVSGGAFCKAQFLTTEEDFEKYKREVDAYYTDLNLLEIYQDKLDDAKASLNE